MPDRRGWRVPRWVWRVLISVLLLIGLPILGLAAGPTLLRAWKNLGTEHWEPLGTPSEMPSEIVDGDLDRVYVRGQDGALFECDLSRPRLDNGCWEEVNQPRAGDPSVKHQNTYPGEIPPPPGPLKEALDVSWMAAERASHLRYALLEDGSVWLWEYHVDANTNLLVLVMVGPFCGLTLAIVIVLVIWLAAGVRALLGGRRAKRRDTVGRGAAK